MFKKIGSLLCSMTLILSLSACQPAAPAQTASAASSPSPGTEPASAATPTYPTKAISVICCYQAGSNQDLATRSITGAMEKILGVPFAVENVVGADGVTGHIQLSAASPDGYTIGITSASPLCVSPYMQAEIPYDYESFDYIGMFLPYMHGFAVNASSEVTNLSELIELAKTEELICGYAGTVNLVNIMKLMKMGGVDTSRITFVPYNSNEIMPALAGGFVDFTCHASSTISSMVESGDVRLIGPLGTQRWSCDESVPTSLEQGFELYSFGGLGLAAPAGISGEQLETLRGAFAKALEDQEFLNYVETVKYNKYFQVGDEYFQALKNDAEQAHTYLAELDLAVK